MTVTVQQWACRAWKRENGKGRLFCLPQEHRRQDLQGRPGTAAGQADSKLVAVGRLEIAKGRLT